MSALQGDFGTELILDLHGCDPATIRSRKKIDTFVRRLCRLIKMKRYGEPLIEHFGHQNPITSGYSLVQLIETSCVSAHFSEGKDSVYLNIFSCKAFDPDQALEFSKDFFGAKRVKRRFVVRK